MLKNRLGGVLLVLVLAAAVLPIRTAAAGQEPPPPPPPAAAAAAEAHPDVRVVDPRWGALPVTGAMPAAPSAALDPTNPQNPGYWLETRAMGSKWLSDNMLLGASVALLSMTAGLMGVVDQAFLFIFTTPESMTTRPTVTAGGPLGSPRALATIMMQAASALIALVLTYRLVGVLWAGRAQAIIDLGMQLVVGIALTWGSWELCHVMVVFANLLAERVIRGAFGGGWPLITIPPVDPAPGVSLVYAIAIAAYYVLLAALAFQAFRRIIVINVLLVVAPLIGVAVVTDGAWGYTRVWFFRMVEALITPVIWALALSVVQALLLVVMTTIPASGVLQATVVALLAAFGYGAVLDAPRLTGLAAREGLAAGKVAAAAGALLFLKIRAGGTK